MNNSKIFVLLPFTYLLLMARSGDVVDGSEVLDISNSVHEEHAQVNPKLNQPLHSDAGLCSTFPGRVHFSLKAVSESSMECDYHYGENVCGPVDVVYKTGSAPISTRLRYTLQSVSFEAQRQDSSWKSLITFEKKFETVFPLTKDIGWQSNRIQVKASISCTCGYEEVDNWNVGIYCRLKGASLTSKPKLYPKSSEVRERVYYPLDCEALCASSPECVLATYHYVKKECHFHFANSFQEMSSEVAHNDPEKDWVVFTGSKDSIVVEFSSYVITHLERENKHELISNAKALVGKLDCFHFLVSKSWNHNGKTMEKTGFIKTVTNSIATLVLEAEHNSLPSLNGRHLIEVLKQGETPLKVFEDTIESLNARSDLAKVKKDISSVMKGQVDAILQQGHFDMKYALREFRFISDKLAAIQKLIGQYQSKVLKNVNTLKGLMKKAEKVKAARKVLDFILNFAAMGNTFQISTVGSIINALQSSVQDLADFVKGGNIMRNMKEGLRKMKSLTSKGIASHEGNTKVLNRVKIFIEKYEKTQGKGLELLESDTTYFLQGFAKYKQPFSPLGIEDAYSYITPGIEQMCETIVEYLPLPALLDQAQAACLDINIQIGLLKMIQDALSSISRTQFLNGAAVVRNYIKIRSNDNLKTTIDSLSEEGIRGQTALDTMKATLKLKSFLIRFFYVIHLKQLCTLADYMSSTPESQECLQIKNIRAVFNTGDIFGYIMKMMLSVSTPSNELTYCGYIPTNHLANDDVGKGNLNLESLTQGNVALFSIPFDQDWLIMNGWDSLLSGVKRGNRYFVKGIQVFLPYPKLGSFYECGTTLDLEVQTAASYTLYDSKGKGRITKYQPYETEPPLPSVFSEFELKVNQRKPGCLSFPNAAVIETKFEDFMPNKLHDSGSKVSRRTLMSKVCISLVKTSSHQDTEKVKTMLTQKNSNATGLSNQVSNNTDKCVICPEGHFHAYPIGAYRFKCLPCPKDSFQSKKGRFYCEKGPSNDADD
eukprot:Nk52_evm3s321 gene=Nk52_evmTU3s321